jgi:hypothetical protein
MAIAAKTKIKTVVRNIKLNADTLSSVTTNDFPGGGWHQFSIDQVTYPDQKNDAELVMIALFGADYDRSNIGSIDTDKGNIYPGNVYKSADGGLLLAFGAMKEGSNNFPITLNSDDEIVGGGHHPVFVTQTEKRMINDKATDVEVPYLAFKIDVPSTDQDDNSINVQVNVKVPFRMENNNGKSVEELQNHWTNDDLENVASMLQSPTSGGGGWASISSIPNTFTMAGLNLNPLEFNVIDFVIIPDNGNGFGDSMDLILHPDWALPFAVDKKGFMTKNSVKIRVMSTHTAFRSLFPLSVSATLKIDRMANGCTLQIKGFHGSDKSFVPRHAIVFKKAIPLVYPDFEELLNIETDEPKSLAAGNEFAIPVAAESVPVDTVSSTDPLDTF